MNRRSFLRGSLAAVGAFVFSRIQSASAASPKKIIKLRNFPWDLPKNS